MADDNSGRRFERVELTGARFRQVNLSGAQLHDVRLNDARFRMVDLSGVVMRGVNLAGVSIDGFNLGGMRVNGVEIASLVQAELVRRQPARAMLRASEPADLRSAWAAVEASWTRTYERVAAMPPGAADVSVAGEWSFAQTLRHLVFATDGWLGAVEGDQRPFHPWGVPFSELDEFVHGGAAALGIDSDAAPSYPEVLELRADRFARVRSFLAEVLPDQLAAEIDGPPWDPRRMSALSCVHVILDEECEHHRFAERDLDAIDAGAER